MDETEINTLADHRYFGRMVMLVDDQPIVAERVRMDLLGESDIDFHYCQDPREAIKTAEVVRPAVILLDLLMPNVDGFRMIQDLKSHEVTCDIPVLVLSAKEDVECKARAFACGANDYLIKLPEREELIARIRCHSRGYIHKMQRDAAFNALRESQRRLEQKNFELMKMSNVDGLTGLSNRRHFDVLLEQVWAHAQRAATPVSILMIDVDYFKGYNDHFGHLGGDDCLRQVAAELSRQLPRTTDFIARYGGEEFAVVLASTDAAGAQKVADKLLRGIDALALANPASEVADHVTISIGLASGIPHPGHQAVHLIDKADQSLYQAKGMGRHRIVNSGLINLADAANQ